MQKPFELIGAIAPGCKYLAAIRIYPDAKSLQKAVGCLSFLEGEIQAFCSFEEGEADTIATLNFCREEMPPEVVAHEVYHAVSEMVRFLRLDISDSNAQELAAYAVTHVVCRVREAERLSKKRK